MDTFEFIASMTSSIAWPSTIIVPVILLKKELQSFIGRLKAVKFGENQIIFAEQLDETMTDAVDNAKDNGLDISILDINKRDISLIEQAEKVIYASPLSSILLSWKAVEQAIRSKFLIDDKKIINLRNILNLNKNRIPSEIISLILDLNGIRNQATHVMDYAITHNTALNYISTARYIIEYFENKK